jgi:hypothetical protein
MNSAISYISAAQTHADAVREGYRNPRPRLETPKPVEPARQPRQRFALRVLFARL